jgi:ABC-type lipoprotein export system ATPase subunit
VKGLKAQDLSFCYPGAPEPVLSHLDIAVDSGDMVAVCGPSGSGKSTLLFLLGLFIVPTEGSIVLAGLDTTRLADAARSRLRAHAIGFVFQDAALDPALTVEENVAEGALYAGFTYASAKAKARCLLDEYGIGDLSDRRPTHISGGQAQRAALCRALIRRPSLILADEPTGNLDQANGDLVIAGLKAAAEAGAGVVIVTHNPEVSEACDYRVQL